MYATATSALAIAALVGLVTVVHELGHYVTARIAGIPASDRRIVFAAFPPHVALPDGGEWVSPFQHERFSAAYHRYDPHRRYRELFTAGGFLGQVALVPLAVGIEVGTGLSVGTAIVTTSLLFVVGYLGYDLAVTVWQGAAHGDTTHLWRLSPAATVGTHAVFFAVHVGALVVLL